MRACGCVCCMPPNGQLSKFGFGQKSRVSSLMFSFRMRQGRAESFSWAFSPPIPCVLTRMLVESKMRTSNCTPNQKRQIGKKQTGPRLSRSPDFGQEHNNLVFYLTRCKGTAIPTRGQYLLLGILRQRTDFFALTRAHVYKRITFFTVICHSARRFRRKVADALRRRPIGGVTPCLTFRTGGNGAFTQWRGRQKKSRACCPICPSE